MVVVAVAGGTGGVGRTIVDALKASPVHTVIVLARKAPDNQDPTAPVVVVDYTSIGGLVKELESNKVHTIISTIAVKDEASGNSEHNLIEAADRSAVTKRFIPDNWAAPIPPAEYFPAHPFRVQTIELLRKSSLEWTEFYNGVFLDYYGMPHLRTHIHPNTFYIDIPSKVAAIPGTGNNRIAFTYSEDVARFVAATLDLKQWDQSYYIIGDTLSLNELLKLAQEATASKFSVTYDTPEVLKKGQASELPSHQKLYPFIPKPILLGIQAMIGSFISDGLFDVAKGTSANEQFPDIKPKSAKAILSVWHGK